jgi:hypothetical protein
MGLTAGCSAAALAGDYRREWRKRYFQILTGDVPRIQYYRDFSVSACSSAQLTTCSSAGLHNSSSTLNQQYTVCYKNKCNPIECVPIVYMNLMLSAVNLHGSASICGSCTQQQIPW